MSDSEPGVSASPPTDWSDLAPRVISALVLVAFALLAAFVGGWIFIAVWTAAAAVVMLEWLQLTGGERYRLRAAPQIAGLGLAGLLAGLHLWMALLPLAAVLMVAALALANPGRRTWDGAGVIYALSLLVAAAAARQSPGFGLVAIIWLFAVVWATDIFAYFAGKTVGGARLWPHVSPKKTWSGVVGGATGGVLGGMATLLAAHIPVTFASAVAALCIALLSEAGDLFESFMKRHFGVKDTGSFIPGHGGLMDRLDGFIVGASCAVIMGWLRVPDDVARGMLIW